MNIQPKDLKVFPDLRPFDEDIPFGDGIAKGTVYEGQMVLTFIPLSDGDYFNNLWGTHDFIEHMYRERVPGAITPLEETHLFRDIHADDMVTLQSARPFSVQPRVKDSRGVGTLENGRKVAVIAPGLDKYWDVEVWDSYHYIWMLHRRLPAPQAAKLPISRGTALAVRGRPRGDLPFCRVSDDTVAFKAGHCIPFESPVWVGKYNADALGLLQDGGVIMRERNTEEVWLLDVKTFMEEVFR